MIYLDILKKKLLSLTDKIFYFLYEKDKILLIKELKKYNQDFKTIFDIGAHKGQYTDLFLSHLKTKRLLLIEPIETLFFILKKKYKSKAYIKIFRYIAGSKNCINFINKTYHTRSSSCMNQNNRSIYYNLKRILIPNSDTAIEKMKEVKLDNFIKIYPNVDLMKIDTEGYELNVLKGCRRYCAEKRVKFFFIEVLNHNLYKNYSKEKIHNFLIRNKYSLIKTFKSRLTFSEDRLYILNSLKQKFNIKH